MQEFNAAEQPIETAAALAAVGAGGLPGGHAAYIGLDVHKETIAIAVAEPGRGEPS